LERLKQGKYNKPHWLRYIRGHWPPGPKEEEEEVVTLEAEKNCLDNIKQRFGNRDLQFPIQALSDANRIMYSY
jgi:hypothetical protein